jgi:hypothetical protein
MASNDMLHKRPQNFGALYANRRAMKEDYADVTSKNRSAAGTIIGS